MLIPKISICVNACKGFTVKNITGWFNEDTNPGGFNDNSTVWVNSTLGNPYVTSAKLEIYLNDVLLDTIDVTETVNDSIYPTFDLYTYLPETLVDGVYRVVFTVEDEDEAVYTTDKIKAVWCNVECCVNKLAFKVAEELCNNCESKAFDNFITANTLLESLEDIAQCLGQEDFLKILGKLQKICGHKTSSGCGCGCS